MKLLTICIPCHNAIETMHKSISSCLLMKEEIEVLIIDNQSQDETYEVAKEYEKEYPETIKVVKNDSLDYSISFVLQHCHGLYFKILSSGDYLDQPSLVNVIETLRDFIRIQANLDLLITDHRYVYEDKKDVKVTYKNIFPTETLFKWHNIKPFQKHYQVDIASFILKTSILKNICDNFKDEVFEENKVIYGTIPYIKSMYYLQTYFHCYQNEKVIHSSDLDNYLNTLKGIWIMYNVYSLKSRKQRNYAIELLSRLYIMTLYLIMKNNQMENKDMLDHYLKEKDERLYKAVTRHFSGALLSVKNEKAQSVVVKLFEKIKKYEVIE